MWKSALFAAVIVVALSGCAAGVEVRDARVAAPVEVAPDQTSAPVLTAAPASPIEEQFLTSAQRIAGLEDVTMEAALTVGNDVCAQLAAGVDPLTLAPVVNGEQQDNEDLVLASALTLCTEQGEATQQAFTARRVELDNETWSK